MTQCSQSSFEFERHCSRRVVAGFDGGARTSDAGALLLRSTERRIGPLSRLAGCFTDFRRQERVEHGVAEMVAQRVYALALGYSDLNDHDQLRDDPLMGLLAGKREPGKALASKSILCSLERTTQAGAAEPCRPGDTGFVRCAGRPRLRPQLPLGDDLAHVPKQRLDQAELDERQMDFPPVHR